MNRWIHDQEQALARKGELRALLRRQLVAITRGHVPACACCQRPPEDAETPADRLVLFALLYRCLQCGLWLCRDCAHDHFPEVPRG